MRINQEHYAVEDIEKRIIAALKAAGLNPDEILTPEELSALDHFHTGGYNASLILQELAKIRASDRVLDIGAGLAGAARMLAASQGCQVDCIELSDDYCVGAKLLNSLTDLEHLVKINKGSALDTQFPNDSYDVAWMQNVGMNIKDKQALYEEIARVLISGGRFVFQEMTAGNSEPLDYPLPWAVDSSENFLLTAHEMQTMLQEAGFIAEYFEDVSDPQLNAKISGSEDNTARVELSLSTYVDNLPIKAENAQRCLIEAKVRFYRGVFVLQ